MIKCLIVDDENYAIETLTAYIDKTDDIELLSAFNSPLKAIGFIDQNKAVDLIFLDIDMPELSGFEFAELLPRNIPIIYTTGHSGYALQSFETNVLDFLLKPISYLKFLKAVNKFRFLSSGKAEENIKVEKDFFFINPGIKGKLIKLNFNDVVFVESLKNYVSINLPSEKFITYLTLTEIEESFPTKNFIRIHRSFIVNIEKIRSIVGNQVYYTDKLSLPIGDNYKDKVLEVALRNAIITKRGTV